MGENKKHTQSMVVCAFLFTAMFGFCFSSAKQIQNYTKMQTQSPNHIGPSFIFRVYGDVHHGFFYASVKIGNSPTPYVLDIDTGSDVTWVQCRMPDRHANLLLQPRLNACLGILNATEENFEHDQNIIGDISMLDKLVIYDNENQRIGWASQNCRGR